MNLKPETRRMKAECFLQKSGSHFINTISEKEEKVGILIDARFIDKLDLSF